MSGLEEITPYESYSMTKAELTDRLVAAFEQQIDLGKNPNDDRIQQEVYHRMNIYPEDLRDGDISRLESEVTAYWTKHRVQNLSQDE